MNKKIILTLFLILVLLMSSCSNQSNVSSNEDKKVNNEVSDNSGNSKPDKELTEDELIEKYKLKEKQNLKIGLMPAVDIAPIFVAKDLGIFDKFNLDVDLEVYANAIDRQAALQAKLVDGTMADIIPLVTSYGSGFDMKATTLTNTKFDIMINKEALNKKDLVLAVMNISSTNYFCDNVSKNYNVEKVYINSLPERLEAVISGKVDGGVFPEPLATASIKRGLSKLENYSAVDFQPPNTMVFMQESIDKKSDAIMAFHRAYDLAVDAISKDENIARKAIVENIPNFNQAVKDEFALPKYNKTSLPTSEHVQEIIQWVSSITEKEYNIEYDQLVNNSFASEVK